ncbi:chaperone modulator CbpM [Pseudomonas sp. R5(2019)]|uniref:chaperone modulator CbpM n=1 Tax=Pseudomonas sp. R5(2019) TaxID=2697566 RepID=UPI001412C5C2|nr:chaperone modulator CbpM [Pseudomonas sp. R5(2019)]NBA95138.1 chaperone modulatory protein CbpM [Pseudomonas sp. R5(2019)]
MNSTLMVQLDMNSFCQAVDLPRAYVIEIVEHGILEPQGRTPDEWLFDDFAPVVAKRAKKLHDDLELEWEGVALAMELLEEVQQLRRENDQLKRRLSRFVL